MNCDQVFHLLTVMSCVELRTMVVVGQEGEGVESILQTVVWYTLSKPILNLHSDYSPYMYFHNSLK